MLDSADIERIARGFGVFEHDWSFYAEFLGEPHLVKDALVYYDSHTLYICAFPFGDVWSESCASDVQDIIDTHEKFHDARAVNVWGRLSDIPEAVKAGDRELTLHSRSDYDSAFTDAVIPSKMFSFGVNRRARLARNSARNKGVATRVVKREFFTSDHFRLMDYWMTAHNISPVHTAFALSTHSFIKHAHVYLIECFRENRLEGFAIISLPNKRAAVLTQAYIANGPGARVGDAIMAGAVEFAAEHQVERLHLGYSATPTLLSFKKKWGASVYGPPFREAFYVSTAGVGELIDSGTFLWRERLFLRQLGDTQAVPLDSNCPENQDGQAL